MARRRVTSAGKTHLGRVDKCLSDAQYRLSEIATSDPAAYELGNDLWGQIEKMRSRILKLTVYGSASSSS